MIQEEIANRIAATIAEVRDGVSDYQEKNINSMNRKHAKLEIMAYEKILIEKVCRKNGMKVALIRKIYLSGRGYE